MFCALLGPRYQVSVYRTIGPLVARSHTNLAVQNMASQASNLEFRK